MKPTVSESSTLGRVSSSKSRVVESSVANRRSSTIMNALTNSGLLVEDRLFATLDSTTRLLEEDTRPKVLLSDTVGFINNLPYEVVAAFRSTLSTVKDADLLLQIVDASDNVDEHLQTTADVLEDLGALCIPILTVFNKIDRISPTRLLMLEKMYPDAVFVSVINTAENRLLKSSTLVDKIRKKILLFFDERMKTVTIRLDYLHSQQLANIYEWSRVDKIDYQEEGIMMTLTTIPGNLERLRHHDTLLLIINVIYPAPFVNI
jgi:GTP-binding protein HflX